MIAKRFAGHLTGWVLVGLVLCGCESETSPPPENNESNASRRMDAPTTSDEQIIRRVSSDPLPDDAPARASSPRSDSPRSDSPRSDSPRSDSPRSNSPRALIRQMIRAYQSALAYADEGVVELRYRMRGKWMVDRADMRVAFSRGDHLANESPRVRLDAYGVTILASDGMLRSVPAKNLRDQLHHQAGKVRHVIPLTDAAFYADRLVSDLARGGMAGPSVQIELLLSPTPLSGLINPSTPLQFGALQTRGGESVRAVEIDIGRAPSASPDSTADVNATNNVDSTAMRLWIGTQTHLLHEIQLPPPPMVLADPNIDRAGLFVVFRNAGFKDSSPRDFRIHDDDLVDVPFVLAPPPPLASALLGQRCKPFRISADLNGAPVVVTENGSDRKCTVLMWVADHAGSYTAAAETAAAIASLPDATRDSIRLVVMNSEPNPKINSLNLLKQHTPGAAVADDTQFVGNDIFSLQTAPSLVLLNQQGIVQWYQSPFTVDSLSALPTVLKEAVGGTNVGRQLRQQWQHDRQQFQDHLRGRAVPSARPSDKG